MPEEFDIQKLLRLKRHEQPPPEYFEEFLREFHHRQREELLRQPLWKIAIERMQAFVGELALPRVAYAGATAVVLISAGLASYNILNPTPRPNLAASATDVTRMEGATKRVVSVQATRPEGVWNPQPLETFQSVKASAQLNTASLATRYVIDTRPVSYEPPSSF